MSLVFFRPPIWVGDSFGFCLATAQPPSMLRLLRVFLRTFARHKFGPGGRGDIYYLVGSIEIFIRDFTLQECNAKPPDVLFTTNSLADLRLIFAINNNIETLEFYFTLKTCEL